MSFTLGIWMSHWEPWGMLSLYKSLLQGLGLVPHP